jgi:hypothetical protein
MMTGSWNDEEITRRLREQESLETLVSMLLKDLPTKRDWLDPGLEGLLREKVGRPKPSEGPGDANGQVGSTNMTPRYRYEEQTLQERKVAGTEAWGRVWEVINTQGDLFVSFCPEEADARLITNTLNQGVSND